MLTQHLREMEEDGLVHREVHAEVPPRVEYSLTEHGRTLNRALGPLGAWGTERMRREGAATVNTADAADEADAADMANMTDTTEAAHA